MLPSQLPSIREFMSREHSEDVRRLNSVLNINGDAGLVDMPPIPFTGDIDAMEPDNCICVLGINPHWPSDNRDAHQNEILPTREMVAAFQDGDGTQYQSFIDSRLNYFRSEMANWVHYKGIGVGYAENFFHGESYQSVWGRNVFAIDILPYWSTGTGKISNSRLRKNIDKDPALVLHQQMITEIIQRVKPSMIHVNGTMAGRLVNYLYCQSEPLKPWDELEREHNLMFGKAAFADLSIPVMTHDQFGQWGPKARHWPEFATAWNEWSA